MTASSQSSARVLLVEDEPVISNMLADILRRSGHEVLQAATVAVAEEIVRSQPLSLCITDFLLPDRTGLDLLTILKEVQPRTRVILVTAYLEPDLARQIEREPSIVEVIRKPMDIFAFRDSVDRVLDEGHEVEEIVANMPPPPPPPRGLNEGLTDIFRA